MIIIMSQFKRKKKYDPEFTVEDLENNKNVVILFHRNINKNIVVYEATFSSPTIFNKNPIDAYWMCIDPEFIRQSRASGNMSDRMEFNFIEQTMAYGISCSPKAGESNVFDVKLVANPDNRPFVLKLDENDIPRVYGKISGKDAIIRSFYINATPNWLGIPTVHYVEINGFLLDGTAIKERITKK
jgi:Domain of unknown function (DUF4833)